MLKEYLVDYVGNTVNNDSDEVTVDMIVEVMAKEFPEFILAIAEENFYRGYTQAISDVELEEKKGVENEN